MNCFVIFQEELQADGSALLQGARAQRLLDSIADSAISLQVALWQGPRGAAKIITKSNELIVLELQLEPVPLQRDFTRIVVGISRPQTVKKVIQAATLLGVRQIDFVRAAQAEKSYLDAQVLEESALRGEVIESLEQGWDGTPPEIRVHHRFKPYLEDVLASQITPTTLCIVGSVSAKSGLEQCKLNSTNDEVIIAIGPEAGWSEYEQSSFQGHGFLPVRTGERVLRVETAVAALCGQLQLLRAQTMQP